MVLTAIRGAVGFLSRLPVGHDEAAWDAFTHTPATFPLAGYLLGALLALPLLLPIPAPTVALAFVLGVYFVTGINHVDGVTDLGDAMAVHGDAAARRAAMKDTVVGTGGALAIALVVLGLGTAGIALADLAPRAVLLVVVAEVGAKFGMATLVCLGTAAHQGLGSALTTSANSRALVPAAIVTLPALGLTWPHLVPALATFLATIAATLLVFWWARSTLGGVSGDVLGAANEIARVVGLHVGVIAWIQW